MTPVATLQHALSEAGRVAESTLLLCPPAAEELRDALRLTASIAAQQARQPDAQVADEFVALRNQLAQAHRSSGGGRIEAACRTLLDLVDAVLDAAAAFGIASSISSAPVDVTAPAIGASEARTEIAARVVTLRHYLHDAGIMQTPGSLMILLGSLEGALEKLHAWLSLAGDLDPSMAAHWIDWLAGAHKLDVPRNPETPLPPFVSGLVAHVRSEIAAIIDALGTLGEPGEAVSRPPPDSRFDYDVFISYANANNDLGRPYQKWVDRLVEKLGEFLRLHTGDALDIYFDKVNYYPNETLDVLLDCARRSRIFIAVSSRAYQNRPWTADELDAFSESNPDLNRLFVVLVEEVPNDMKLEKLRNRGDVIKLYREVKTDGGKPTLPLKPDTQEFAARVKVLSDRIYYELQRMEPA